jgi:hypothetical protein
LSRLGLGRRHTPRRLDALSSTEDWPPASRPCVVAAAHLETRQRSRGGGPDSSASGLADDERQGLAFGADFFLGKPYDNRELMDRIARVLETASRASAPRAGEVGLDEGTAAP